MRPLSPYLGKTTFFVSNQANFEAVSADKIAALEEEYKVIDDANKLTAAELRTCNAGGYACNCAIN